MDNSLRIEIQTSGYLVQTEESGMDMEFTGEPVTRFLQNVKLCLLEKWGGK